MIGITKTKVPYKYTNTDGYKITVGDRWSEKSIEITKKQALKLIVKIILGGWYK